ncbi:MAG: hypothetical protein MUP74_00790, partial [Desulfobacterales bacterium]|nr:hypothetical protein [Desulfobacterales bacterium]
MEFIQRKTADGAVDHFLLKAAARETSMAWDRFEGQLPECGFCEAGLSCRDCLLGPCISHPFRDQNKLGVCGKDKDIMAAQTLLRLVLKGAMASLDHAGEFADGLAGGAFEPQDKALAEETARAFQALVQQGVNGKTAFPAAMVENWKALGICPEGIARDIFKAFQKLEGGVADVEETLLWAFKAALLGQLAKGLQGQLKRAVFGDAKPAQIDVNLGVISEAKPSILVCGTVSPVLKAQIAAVARDEVQVIGLCTDPVVAGYRFSPVTTSASQEVPLMTGAVDLIVAGDHFVSPSLEKFAKEWHVTVIRAEGLKKQSDPGAFAADIVAKAKNAFELRRDVPRDVPKAKETAVMGFSAGKLDLSKIADALKAGKIKGIAILAGSNNVKYTQDGELVTLAQEFLKNDILCVSEGDASVSLAKYGFLNPQKAEKNAGQGLAELLAALGADVPEILDFGSCENAGLAEFLLGLRQAGGQDLKELPIAAYFPEASRSTEVAEALGLVAMGVSVYFWPCLPVTGSSKTMKGLSEFCTATFGARLNVITKKMEA